MRHFLNTADWPRDALQSLLDDAKALKAAPYGDALTNKDDCAFVSQQFTAHADLV